MSTTILRVIFMLVFATTGFLLGREAYTHLISLHVASQLWLIVLTLVAPVAGAVLGIFIAPLAQSVFEFELRAVEEAVERLSPAEIVGGSIGLIAGLVFAFLVKSVLFEFIASGGAAGGYVATVPALPGCVSQGDSRTEALANIREAIELYVEDCREAGDPVPTEVGKEFVEVEAA